MLTPTTTYHGPGSGNVWIPGSDYLMSPGATGMMQVEFSRNPARFGFNQYVSLVLGAKPSGFYPVLDTDEAVRIVNLQDFEWPDGNDAPEGHGRDLVWKSYNTNRRAFPFKLGDKARQNATFDVIGANSRMSATQAMSARAYDAISLITTAANWPTGSKAATVDALISGTSASWISSSTTQLFIQRSFHTVIESILKLTGGVVGSEDIMCVIGPDTAHKMSRTAEVRAYITNNESAVPYWENTGIFARYNLPPRMYGVNMVVEDAVRVSTRKGASSTTRAFMMGDSAVFCSRPFGLTGGVEGAPTFSTVTAFVHEDMTVETLDDRKNRRMVGRTVDDIDVVLSAPISGYHIADITT